MVAGELLEQVGRHHPLRLMLRNEVDKVVDVAEPIVDAAMPFSYAGKEDKNMFAWSKIMLPELITISTKVFIPLKFN